MRRWTGRSSRGSSARSNRTKTPPGIAARRVLPSGAVSALIWRPYAGEQTRQAWRAYKPSDGSRGLGAARNLRFSSWAPVQRAAGSAGEMNLESGSCGCGEEQAERGPQGGPGITGPLNMAPVRRRPLFSPTGFSLITVSRFARSLTQVRSANRHGSRPTWSSRPGLGAAPRRRGELSGLLRRMRGVCTARVAARH
jgi:hypothetical protein